MKINERLKFSWLVATAIAIGFSSILSRPIYGNLGDADTTGGMHQRTSGKTYDAWCGIEYKDCKVRFKNDRLTVNSDEGILSDQVVSITKESLCRIQAGWGASGCQNTYGAVFTGLFNKEYTIEYNSEEGYRSALITFRHDGTDKKFNRDLEIWIGEIMSPISSNIKKIGKRKERLSPQLPKQKFACHQSLKQYECSYNKYLEANPSMKSWADANPEIAREERVKLKSVD